ncbi:MAG: Fis family transcriptional regulator [Gammaproteobacteria bacterium]|nr:MAG: Fis family transcriptional regulator [Gammaproteobacteria bacterium]
MKKKQIFNLESLLETHNHPFKVIDAALNVVAVNRAWEIYFGTDRNDCIGQPCCADNGNNVCRHKKLFQSLEPYAGVYPHELPGDEQANLRVRGYPLLDSDGALYIGESVIPTASNTNHSKQPRMLGKSSAFNLLETTLKKAARVETPVLLLGETGTGKELAAAFVHQHSNRAEGKFVVVDCTSLGEDLFESELFGHEKGSFTGAVGAKKGLFQLAHQGTLFLDEVGELPLSQQPKLLRALESGQFRRVGGTTIHHSDVRVVCATHRNLAEMVSRGDFREDLYYRLSVFPVQIQPLRDRRKDIPLLCDHLLKQIGEVNDCQYTLTKQALIKLLQHSWPGNIRELRNIMQLAAALCDNQIIDESNIQIQPAIPKMAPPPDQPGVVTKTGSDINLNPLERIEADFINELMEKLGGSRKAIAKEMNVSERTLYRKLKRYNLSQPTH